MTLCLTGFMGCGKSSVGRELSRLLCCPFMDLDDVIVEREGRSIPEIFASEGEAAFRKMELEALQEIIGKMSDVAVLALGGGTVMTKECADLVNERTLCIYLRASADTLVSHLSDESDGRPMLQGDLRSRIEELMEKRSATYEKTAHIIIDTDGRSIEDIAGEIRRTDVTPVLRGL